MASELYKNLVLAIPKGTLEDLWVMA